MFAAGITYSMRARGIGGRYEKSCGTIIFKGSVKANVEGGSFASAIGGGWRSLHSYKLPSMD